MWKKSAIAGVAIILIISAFVFWLVTLGEIREYKSYSESHCILEAAEYHTYASMHLSDCRCMSRCEGSSCTQVLDSQEGANLSTTREGICCNGPCRSNGVQKCAFALRNLLRGSVWYSDQFGRRFVLEFEGRDAAFRYGNATCWTNDSKLRFEEPVVFFPSFVWYLLAICLLIGIGGAAVLVRCNQRSLQSVASAETCVSISTAKH